MKAGLRLTILVLLISGLTEPLRADIVFPARLELAEIEPGVFDLQFNLPVQNQMVIKATPVLPSACLEIAPPEESSTQTRYTSQWQVKCAAEALIGQPIGVDGLLGSSIDVILSIQTLDGRQFDAVLKPARAMVVIPTPPSLGALTGEAVRDGLQACFRRADVHLLMWVVVLLGFRRRPVILTLFVSAAAFALAQTLTRQNLLLIPPSLPAVLALLMMLYLAARFARGQYEQDEPRLRVWVVGFFLVALYGGASPGIQVQEYLSRVEQSVAFIGYVVGILAGLFILLLLFVEFLHVICLIPGLRQAPKECTTLGTITGIAALGLLLYQLSAVDLLPSLAPAAPVAFLVVTILSGLLAGRAESGSLLRWAVLGAPILVTGLVSGASGIQLPAQSLVVPIALFVLGISLVSRRDLPRSAGVVIVAVAVFYSATKGGGLIQEDLSKPIAHLAGVGLSAAIIFLFAGTIGRSAATRFPHGIRFAGACAVLVALFLCEREYVRWFHTAFISDYAMGFIRLPALSLLLVLMAVIVWPRRSKVAAHLNIATRKPVAHLALLTLAVFLGTACTVKLRNPAFKQEAPKPDQARQIIRSILSNTYSAFNLDDEEQLYAQLSENVGEDLVEDLYLDSRRRLTSGVRAGATVTVKDVRVVTVGEALDGAGASDTFAYNCEWAVTARVQHLQHVHHRQNSYSGVLTIRVNDGRWKIEQVALESEDRRVVTGSPA